MGKKGKKAKDVDRHQRWWNDKEDSMAEDRWRDHALGPARDDTPPDPEIVRAVTDYRVFNGEADLTNLAKPLTWYMAGNGLVPVRMSPLGLFIGKGSGPLMPGLPSLLPTVLLNCPKIPWGGLVNVVAFFRRISKEIDAEAMVQFFWDPEQAEFVAHVPVQLVTSGGVHHAGHFDADGKCWHVLDIHSHHKMAPFWSGTDDDDEKRFEGRLFGVVGHIDREIPEIRWRTRVGGAFVDLSIHDVIDLTGAPEVHLDRTFQAADLLAAAGKEDNNIHFRFDFDPFRDAAYPEEWNQAVVDMAELGKRIAARKAGPRAVTFGSYQPTDDEKAELKAIGLVEVTPGHWERATTNLTTGFAPPNPSRPPLNSAGPAGDGTDSRRWQYPGIGKRSSYIFDRIAKRLYFEATDGFLYPSYQAIEAVAKTSASIKFVDHVDEDKIRLVIGVEGRS